MFCYLLELFKKNLHSGCYYKNAFQHVCLFNNCVYTSTLKYKLDSFKIETFLGKVTLPSFMFIS